MKAAMVLSILFLSTMAAADEMQAPPQGGIPESAYTACSGKAQGESATDGPMTGTCEVGPDGQLALRPSGAPPSQANGQSPKAPAEQSQSASAASDVSASYGGQ